MNAQLVIALAVGLCLSAPLPAQDMKLLQRKGAQCQAIRGDSAAGETHECFFLPQAFGKRDFSRRNGRAQYVFSELGPDCEEIEILGDSARPHAEHELRRVGLRCIR